MGAPRLTHAITWERFEKAVLAVFREALRRLAQKTELPRLEEPINLELYWLVRQVHLEMLKSNQAAMLPYTVQFDSTNQPEADDIARSNRLRKRPDFNCVMTNPQAPDVRTSQINYYLECKRLGQAVGKWVLNDNYSGHGINRFIHPDWQYGKGCNSATMIGYMQDITPDAILSEVNTGAEQRKLPSLSVAAANWVTKDVTSLTQAPLERSFSPTPFPLGHLWVDLRHCRFIIAATASSAPATPPSTSASATSPIRSASRKTGSTRGEEKGS